MNSQRNKLLNYLSEIFINKPCPMYDHYPFQDAEDMIMEAYKQGYKDGLKDVAPEVPDPESNFPNAS